ncbi:MAG: hypothetical protein M3010_10335 [Candidatus Dormibacteraeota bacterium]|nr:hypothetical protein [Candidatus Dormibacteraeota bacterium]
MRRQLHLVALAVAAAGLGGCGSSSGGSVSVPKIAAARVFTLASFSPTQTISVGRPTTMSFTVALPSGQPLTAYKTGPGPHTGIHLIIVRDDLAYIIHDHPPISASGQLRQRVTFPAPGRYRVLVDAYPNLPGSQPNFQLFRSVTVQGTYRPARLPPFRADQVIDGYRFAMQGHTTLHAIQAAFLHINVTDPHGHPVRFTPWFGALAHAIFFHAGSLDYFHTHVCGPGAANCTSILGATRVTGHATAPGKLTLGVLLPVPGSWRLFLQMRVHGHVLTAPFTLQAAA